MNARFSGEPEARPLADSRARSSAIETYLALYEDHATTAQLNIGNPEGPKHAHAAMSALDAADGESMNPEPSFVRDCACVGCRLYRLVADKSVPAMECFA